MQSSAFLEIVPTEAPLERAVMEIVYGHGVRLRLFAVPASAELEHLIAVGHRFA